MTTPLTEDLFIPGSPANTFSVVPTRTFRVVIDPDLIAELLNGQFNKTLQLIEDLRKIEPPVELECLLPLDTLPARLGTSVGRSLFKTIKVPPEARHFKLDEEIDNHLEQKFSSSAVNLLAFTDDVQADALVTNSSELLKARYIIPSYHDILIVPLTEFSDFAEICAHGHSIFWSASSGDRRQTVDTYYMNVHPEGSRYSQKYRDIQQALDNEDLREHLRSALLNRIPFLFYCRDQIRFYSLQKDHFKRRGLLNRFFLSLGYHITLYRHNELYQSVIS